MLIILALLLHLVFACLVLGFCSDMRQSCCGAQAAHKPAAVFLSADQNSQFTSRRQKADCEVYDEDAHRSQASTFTFSVGRRVPSKSFVAPALFCLLCSPFCRSRGASIPGSVAQRSLGRVTKLFLFLAPLLSVPWSQGDLAGKMWYNIQAVSSQIWLLD